MSASEPTREVITNGTHRTTIERPLSRITELTADQAMVVFNIYQDAISPANYDKADGAPLRVLNSTAAKLDISKRSVEDMGFWHRSVDYSEIIICVRGALRWETELGVTILRPGDVLYIPRGIAHRSALCEDSLEENVLIEVKVNDDLTYSGPTEALQDV